MIVYKAIKNSQVDSIRYEVWAENFSLKLKNKSELKKVSQLEGIEKIAISNYIDSSGLDYKTTFNISCVDENYIKVNGLELESGRMPRDKNEIVIETWILKNINSKINFGDRISLDLYNNGKEI